MSFVTLTIFVLQGAPVGVVIKAKNDLTFNQDIIGANPSCLLDDFFETKIQSIQRSLSFPNGSLRRDVKMDNINIV